MPLLKSLFCINGFENGRRFLAINLTIYILFLLLSSLLAKAAVLQILWLLVATPIIIASAIRRVRDAGFNVLLAAIPSLVFVLSDLSISYVQHAAIYALLVVVCLTTLAMATLSNAKVRRNRHYVLGYSGPVDLTGEASVQAQQSFNRIEPTLVASHTEGQELLESEVAGDSDSESDEALTQRQPGKVQFEEELSLFSKERENFISAKQTTVQANPAIHSANLGWEQRLHHWVSANRLHSAVVVGGLVVVTLMLVIWSLQDSSPVQPLDNPQLDKTIEAKERLNKLEMPDNYWLMLDQHNALTIAWQGSVNDEGEYWSALTGQGDKDCVEVRFDNGVKFRSLAVTIKNQGDYYADFSPIDTPKLIESIARLSRFKLCGIEFSLKGTQAKLMSNRKYSSYLVEE